MNKKLLIISIVVLAVSMLSLSALAFADAFAEESETLYVHFYNGENVYTYDTWEGASNVKWGVYYWIDTGRVNVEPAADPDFARTVDGVLNEGQVFAIHLNPSELKAVKQGKKLGLIMVRCYVDDLGYWTPYWRNNTGKDLSSDRFIDVKFENGRYDVWIIAGDKNNYQTLQDAENAFERIESAHFDDFDTLVLQTTKPITTSTLINIYKVTDAVTSPKGVLYKEGVTPSSVSDNGLRSTVTGLGLAADFDWHADYRVEIPGVIGSLTSATKTRLFLSDKFDTGCVPKNDPTLGVTYTTAATTFRVWAPISTNVYIKFYRTGNELDTDNERPARAMNRLDKGIWEWTETGDLDGIYYTYLNYVDGDVYETVDVYATAVGVNGNRAMICDLDATDPDGWESDLATAQTIRDTKSESGVIWEIHVRDFSISPDSGLIYKGKYLAFTESDDNDTYVKGSSTLLSGVSYLKQLGVSYVHLNPVYDFSTVDEEYINNTDYTTKQNWGYDPKNYNVPEGSYATNAENGAVRINEFKQMVQALHNAGIGVIMDVVYNHTYTADSYFEHTVPGYYYRQALSDANGTFDRRAWTVNALGAYNLSDGSGCSNETASERAMYRKYMIDSLVYWATEYHIDGFRFDLMAIHDVATMNAIRAALDAIPDGGSGILLYGEPWAAGALGLDPALGESADTSHLGSMSGIKAFNDNMRMGIKGDNNGGKGYVQGNFSDDVINKVKAGINGYFADASYVGNSHSVTYTTSHDNYTLWDQLINTTVSAKSATIFSEPNNVLIRKNIMAATLTLTSKGMGFMLAGEEFGRTKYGNHNSYNAQDKVNALDYNRQRQFAALVDWYRGLIQLRTEFGSMTDLGNAANIYVDGDDCICYIYNRCNSTDAYSKVYVLMNPRGYAQTLTIDGTWSILADNGGFDRSLTHNASGAITLPAYSTYILVQK